MTAPDIDDDETQEPELICAQYFPGSWSETWGGEPPSTCGESIPCRQHGSMYAAALNADGSIGDFVNDDDGDDYPRGRDEDR